LKNEPESINKQKIMPFGEEIKIENFENRICQTEEKERIPNEDDLEALNV
jgi:hypothetical protein